MSICHDCRSSFDYQMQKRTEAEETLKQYVSSCFVHSLISQPLHTDERSGQLTILYCEGAGWQDYVVDFKGGKLRLGTRLTYYGKI